jgi:PKD repeat protein
VIGGNVPQGPQPYALVVDGVFGAVDTPPTVSIVSPAQGATVSGSVAIEIDATDVEDAAGTLTVEWNVDGGAWQGTTYSGGLYVATWDSTGVGDGARTINARATDSASNVGTDSVGVTVDNVNDPPVATFTFDCTQLTCDFDASGSYDPDGSIVSWDWDFGDTNTGSGETTSHTYAAAGDYTVVLTVTDNESATDTDTQIVSVSDAVPTLYVFDIAMTGKRAGPNRNATATVTIHEVGDVPVAGATVSGTWTYPGGSTTSASGVTLADGTIIFTSAKVKSAGTFTFTVTDVDKSGYTYDPALNVMTSGSIDVP